MQQQQQQNINFKLSNEMMIKKSLDDLQIRKTHIFKQMEELNKQELNIKSKLSQQEYDYVIRYVNNLLASSQPQLQQQQQQPPTVIQQQLLNVSSSLLMNTSNTSSNDMDSTLVTDNSFL